MEFVHAVQCQLYLLPNWSSQHLPKTRVDDQIVQLLALAIAALTILHRANGAAEFLEALKLPSGLIVDTGSGMNFSGTRV